MPRPSGTPAAGATSNDVARRAGVSQKTVSRVMNNEQYVRTEVRDKVLAAARDLGYRPNAAARTLTSGRSRRLGVVTLNESLFGPASMLKVLEGVAHRHGYSLGVAFSHLEDDEDDTRRALERLLAQDVDGVVLTETTVDDGDDLAVPVPALTIGRFPHLTASRRIRSTEQPDRSGALATQHLIDLGHREIRHVAGPPQWWAARDRADGWRTALHAAGLEAHSPLTGDWSVRSGYDAGRVLAADDEATAVFVANDDMAIGVVRALAEAGRDVPDAVSVVGMDDSPASAFLRPSLTTVAQDFTGVVQEGVERLIALIEDPALPSSMLGEHAFPLRVRESTAPPRPGGAAVSPPTVGW